MGLAVGPGVGSREGYLEEGSIVGASVAAAATLVNHAPLSAGFKDVGAELVGHDVAGAAVGSAESSNGTITTTSSSESDCCVDKRSSGVTAFGAPLPMSPPSGEAEGGGGTSSLPAAPFGLFFTASPTPAPMAIVRAKKTTMSQFLRRNFR